MSFVIRRKKDGLYAAGRAAHSLVEDLQDARVYPRKVDAMNSATWWRPHTWVVVPVRIVEVADEAR